MEIESSVLPGSGQWFKDESCCFRVGRDRAHVGVIKDPVLFCIAANSSLTSVDLGQQDL